MEKKELAIVTYIKKFGLEDAIKTFKLKCKEYDHKILLKYDQIESDSSLEEVQECRGLILERGTWKVMSLAFTRFFNSAEGHAATIDWNTAHVLEKLDGSMIHVYYDWNNKSWYAATTGTGEGEGEVNNKLGTTFNELFWSTVKDKYNLLPTNLVKYFTYIFELTTPYNIVVKPHGESSATLLAMRDLMSLNEIEYTKLHDIANHYGFPVVKSYDLNDGNVGRLLRTFETMVWSDEGYVVIDGNFNRIKVKNPAYVAVHHTKNRTSEHAIMTVIKTNEMDEYIATFPDRKDEILELQVNYNLLILKLETVWDKLKLLTPKNISPNESKRFAMEVFKNIKDTDIEEFSGLFFNLKDYKVESVRQYMMGYDDKKLYIKLLKEFKK